MSLRQVAGPFYIKNPDGTNFAVASKFPIMWMPNMGAILQEGTGGFPLSIVTLDGVACPVSEAVRPDYGGGGVWYWDGAKQLIITEMDSYREKICLCRVQYPHFPFTRPLAPFGRGGSGGIYLNKAYVLAWSGGYLQVAEEGGSYTPLHYLGAADCQCGGPGRTESEFFFAECPDYGQANTQMYFYNAVTDVVTGPMYLSVPGWMAVYAPEFQLVMSFHTDTNGAWFINLWSLDTQPTNISPVTLKTGVVKSGGMATFQVTVTGDHSEPCVGELVNWSLTGAGTLIDVQTTTDATGTATCRVFYPVGTTASPSGVTASVTI